MNVDVYGLAKIRKSFKESESHELQKVFKPAQRHDGICIKDNQEAPV